METAPTAEVALLIDADNVSPTHAPAIVARARSEGDLRIARAYGRAEQLKGWTVPGLRRIIDDAAPGRTDMLLAMEAVELALTQGLRRFVIVSSDGDYAQLALFLREKGCRVAGIGTEKAPDRLRVACHRFDDLLTTTPITPAPPQAPPEAGPRVAPDAFDRQIISTLKTNGGRLKLTSLNALHHKAGRTPIASTPHKTWRAYLSSRPDLFGLDPRGPDATVRLR